MCQIHCKGGGALPRKAFIDPPGKESNPRVLLRKKNSGPDWPGLGAGSVRE